jgi:hypothetical protein
MGLIENLLAEERDLLAKLEGVRHLLAMYQHGAGSPPPARRPTNVVPATSRAKVAPPPPSFLDEGRAEALRIDRFGPYGTEIIEKSAAMLPEYGDSPVMTRDLVDRLEKSGVEVRGTNKVNALSALLARSSRLKAHGRRGWTRAESVKGADEAPKENEPTSGSAVGSNAADEGVPPPNSALGHSNSPERGS